MEGLVKDFTSFVKNVGSSTPIHSPWFFGDLLEAVKNAPTYHVILEVLLVALVLRLWFYSSYKIEREELSEEEQDQLIRDWEPEPLVQHIQPEQASQGVVTNYNNDCTFLDVNQNIISGAVGKYTCINNIQCLDVASFNFLGIIGDKRVEEASLTALNKYGVGSCGPRGFYGTIDAHLELEKRIAEFMKVEEAIIYSYGFSTVASAIAAYAKKGDILYVDEAVNFAIQQGIRASRSKVKWFKHNDMEDLERLLKDQAVEDRKNPKKAKVTRTFMIVEGLYLNRGTLCNLPKLIDFKYAYKVRLLIDESYSFATIGATGRGVTEYYKCDVTDIDWICGSLETSIGTVGGFCCGSSYVIDHQRLSGSGYCFSASAPPLLSVAAIQALDIIEKEPELFERLTENSKLLHEKMSSLHSVVCISDAESPVQHLILQEPSMSHSDCVKFLVSLRDDLLKKGYAVAVSAHINQFEIFRQRPSLRLTVKSSWTPQDVDSFVQNFKANLNLL